MNKQHALRAIKDLNEFALDAAHFDASDGYTAAELRQYANEGIKLCARAKQALSTTHCKRKLTKQEIADLHGVINHALAEAEQTLNELDAE